MTRKPHFPLHFWLHFPHFPRMFHFFLQMPATPPPPYYYTPLSSNLASNNNKQQQATTCLFSILAITRSYGSHSMLPFVCTKPPVS